MKLKVGLVGSRGLVGSILMQRMIEENDFDSIDAYFFSSSQMGQPVSAFLHLRYRDAYDLEQLAGMDVILTCQGSDYTQKVYEPLRQNGWQGYFIDAASHLRLAQDSVICLDPVNEDVIRQALKAGIKTFVGGNCTVSLMLMALHKVIETGEVESLTAMTYQAASGAGNTAMQALIDEMHHFGESTTHRGLAGNLFPWIDTDLGKGISREEAKMMTEATKILGFETPMDCLCVRVGVLRCHSQAITLRMKRAFSEEEITALIASCNPWVKIIPNDQESTLQGLTPAAVSGTLDIAVGRIRKLNIPGHCFALFTVGDQLLWGAAEPLRRMLKILQA